MPRDKRYKDPIRRSKNIGTAKQGRGRDNLFVVPDYKFDQRVSGGRVSSPVIVPSRIGRHEFSILERRDLVFV